MIAILDTFQNGEKKPCVLYYILTITSLKTYFTIQILYLHNYCMDCSCKILKFYNL